MWKHDVDWDYNSMLLIMKKKLEYMIKCIDKYGIHLHKDRDVRRMQFTVDLIDRILERNHIDLAESEFRKAPWRGHDLPGPELTDKEIKSGRRYLDHVTYLEEQDWEYLWKYISKYMRGWWD